MSLCVAVLPRTTFRQFIPLTEYSLEVILLMNWDVEYTSAFGGWWEVLSEAEQESVAASVRLLEEYGPYLRHPHSSHISGSRCGHMRELRVQHEGYPYRVLYAFDPSRTAILLLGGNKGGDERWYQRNVPRADTLYGEHIEQLKQEETENGQEVC
jgi:hypothetical protein